LTRTALLSTLIGSILNNGMDFLKQNSSAIGFGVLLLVGIIVYTTFFAGSPSSPAALTASDADTALSQKLLVTLQNLHTIKLDNSIFSDPAFQSLTDFGVVLPPQQPGRRNPFAPLGGVSSGQGAAGTINLVLPKTK
jgi:hypothetical protein